MAPGQTYSNLRGDHKTLAHLWNIVRRWPRADSSHICIDIEHVQFKIVRVHVPECAAHTRILRCIHAISGFVDVCKNSKTGEARHSDWTFRVE